MEHHNLSDLLRAEAAKQPRPRPKRSSQPTKAELTAQLATMAEALNAAQAEAASYGAERDQLRQEVHDWRDRYAQLQAELEQLQATHRELQAEFEEAKQVIRELTAPHPYRFEDVGFKPLVNEIPTPNPEAARLGDAEIGWFD
ncbi:hypothetical protein L5470_09545 [Synechococcus sp. PCC 6717]|uniref:Uncharacterized protein n=1 Tax=Parathermosynechococcus lividus PCC 6715 TaxID=1917166 RepID=A0A2D2Q2A0_PARLV|nr:hypothetical protein [Thermostichus lividus]ATS18624.1 hypothetical protein BRW62_07505 [Thermostichus lividus PCC 6715]MCI3281214.1 hypothetical protein [Synechococcus sp. PCC 6717]